MKKLIGAALVAAAGAVASADPVDVTYTVSGSSGNWTLDFSVTNNLNPADMDVYFFGVYLDSGRDIVGSPAFYDPNAWTVWDNSGYGGSNTQYNNNWIDLSTFSALLPGQTLSGFQARSTDAAKPTSVPWFAFGYSLSGGAYQGTGYFNADWNPGFEGIAHEIPAPGALAALGLVGLAATRRRR